MTADTRMKRCSRCRNEYPATPEFFHRRAGSHDGCSGYCRKCSRQYSKSRTQSPVDSYEAWLLKHTLQEFDAIAPDNRLACMIRRLAYGDCLTCGDWTLERQCCQQIAGDDASGKCLVKGSYAEYMLYHGDTFIGVFDIRADDCTTVYMQQDRYAHYLMTQCGWTVEHTRRVPGGAITPPDTCLMYAKRLVKVPSKCNQSRTRRRAADSQHQTA